MENQNIKVKYVITLAITYNMNQKTSVTNMQQSSIRYNM